MAYIPSAVHSRNAFVRPSGEGGMSDVPSDAPASMVTIRGLPRDATVQINDVPTLGSRTGSGGVDWTGPAPNDLVSVRVVAADGSTRGASAFPPATLDYSAMSVVGGEPGIVDTGRFTHVVGVGTLSLVGAHAGWTAALARLNPNPAPVGAITFDASGAFTQANLPVGSYALLIGRAAGDNQSRTVTITAGATTTEDVGSYFPAARLPNLTVTGMPGWVVAIALPGSTVPLTPPATIPPTGGITVPAPVGSYDLAVSDGTRPIQVRRITVTAAGLTVDTRSFFDATGGAPATTANLTVTGTAGWMLTLTPSGSTAFVNRLPILAGGTVAFPVAPGSYSLRVDDGAGHTASRDITVPVAGLAVDVGPWLASQIASTQGPTTAAPTKGTVRLSGAPPQSVVAMPAAGLSYTVDATGRPVALDVLPGTYALTVTPIGSAPRAQSVTVVAGQTVEVTYGAMPTPSAQTADTGLQPVDAMCGPVLNRAALPWAPATACPGNELAAPDGTRWRALAATGGVTLAQLKANGTPADTGMSLSTKVLIVGVVAAAGYAGWMWYSNRKGGKQENPSKCSCGG